MAWSAFVAMESLTHTNPPCPDPLKPASGAALLVHLYYCSQSSSSSTLSYPPADYTAEELCIKAAKECGECEWVGVIPLPNHRQASQ